MDAAGCSRIMFSYMCISYLLHEFFEGIEGAGRAGAGRGSRILMESLISGFTSSSHQFFIPLYSDIGCFGFYFAAASSFCLSVCLSAGLVVRQPPL